ncbi:hypothetical protein D3C83_51620 [compost metagenome]
MRTTYRAAPTSSSHHDSRNSAAIFGGRGLRGAFCGADFEADSVRKKLPFQFQRIISQPKTVIEVEFPCVDTNFRSLLQFDFPAPAHI